MPRFRIPRIPRLLVEIRRRQYILLSIYLVVLIEVFSVQPHRLGEPPANERNYRLGAIHVHSTYSHDGGGSVETIVEQAKKSGLDFVMLTDHANTNARDDGWERNHDGLDLFVETEVSLTMGHVLTVAGHTPARNFPYPKLHNASEKRVLGEAEIDPNAFQIIAHPTSLKRPWGRLELMTDGIEVVNFDSLWQHQARYSPLSFLLTVLSYPFNRTLSALRFIDAPPKAKQIWDHMNSTSIGHFGILAHDAHSRLQFSKTRYIQWPSYRRLFKIASNAVFVDENLSSDFSTRQKQIYQSLRAGRSALVFPIVHPFHGNQWNIRCANQNYSVGDNFSLQNQKDCVSEVSWPEDIPFALEARLYRNGQLVRTTRLGAETSQLPVREPGVYRLELWARVHSLLHLALRRDAPYLVYNPIYVRP